jgi:hypothetical protein
VSNWLAIATVSGVLTARTTSHLTQAGLSFDVTASHPTDAATSGTFIHLYSVLPNAALRNDTLPERSPAGTLRVPPRLALDLHYQFTFVGAAATYDGERMAGAVMTGLHADPVLSPEEITAFIAAQPAGSVLAASDLADQVEQVRVTQLSSDVEELSRLWGMSQRGFHRLSVLYRVSVVLLEPELPTVRPLPVTEPAVTVYQLRAPRIAAVESSARPVAIVQFDEQLVITGAQLRGNVTLVVLSDQRREPTASTDTELRLTFDAGSGLRAGVYPLQVRHQITLPNGTVRDSAASNTVPVALVPTVSALSVATVAAGNPPVVVGHAVQATLAPVPATTQEVELTLTSTGDGAQLRSTGFSVSGGNVTFDFTPPIAAGSYLVRAGVDGGESLLTQNAAGAFTGPVLVVP